MQEQLSVAVTSESHQLWWTVKWCGCGVVAVMTLLGNTVTSSIESAQLVIGGVAGRPTSATSASLATVNHITLLL